MRQQESVRIAPLYERKHESLPLVHDILVHSSDRIEFDPSASLGQCLVIIRMWVGV